MHVPLHRNASGVALVLATMAPRLCVVSLTTRGATAGTVRRGGVDEDFARDSEIGGEFALLSLAADEPYDIVQTDMQIPVLGGYAAVQRLRAS